jgi:glycine/D-amino acid oxidase-like deaminating enzyme
MGASALWHLTDSGCSDVVLLERDTVASGSTSKAAGGMRAQFSDPLNSRIGLAGIERYSRLAEQFGEDIGFRQHGYLNLLTDERDVALFDADLDTQPELGIGARRIDRDEVGELVPEIPLITDYARRFDIHREGRGLLLGGGSEYPSGLLSATGFSGHGLMQGPVIGEHLAQLSLGLTPTFDLSPFSVERFAAGVQRPELHLV